MRKKYEYWLDYDTLNFHASIIKAPAGMSDNDVERISGAQNGVRGPFLTVAEAKKEGRGLLNDDIAELKRMISNLSDGPVLIGDNEEGE